MASTSACTVTVDDTLALERSSLGPCTAGQEGQIRYNGTAHFACDGAT